MPPWVKGFSRTVTSRSSTLCSVKSVPSKYNHDRLHFTVSPVCALGTSNWTSFRTCSLLMPWVVAMAVETVVKAFLIEVRLRADST